MSDRFAELARLGVATVHEAAGRAAIVDVPLVQVVPGSRAAGPARTVLCSQDDNLMVHAAVAQAEPGEVLVLLMPEPRPVALVGELIATQAKVAGVAALLVDGAVRDLEELRSPGIIGEPVEVAGARIRPGDVVVLDADGAVVVERERVDEVLGAALAREEREREKRKQLEAGAFSYDLDGLRELVERR